jgi:Protein of unknown function (DUF3014)
MWNTESDADESFRKKVIWGSAAIVLGGLIGAVYYYKYYGRVSAPPAPTEAPHVATTPPQNATEPAIRNPVPEGTDTKPLPPLKDSDPDVHDSLVALFGARAVSQFLVPENIVRHIVVTIDNLPRKKAAVELRPVKPTPGATATATQGDVTTLGTKNYERYAPFIKVVQTTDTKTLADIYFKLYPLFQQSYEDLGYPGQYFNDRLVVVIDDLLQTPDVQGPIELTQPRVFYEYADPKLESRSAGQKLLLRMGPANEAIVKAKLRELRKAVANRTEEPVTH